MGEALIVVLFERKSRLEQAKASYQISMGALVNWLVGWTGISFWLCPGRQVHALQHGILAVHQDKISTIAKDA